MNLYVRIKKKIYNFFYSEQWKIILEITSEGRRITYQPPPDRYWADPFPVEYENKLYLFFEEHIHGCPGHISVFLINKESFAIEKYYKNILKCNYHVSYPFVFQYNGSYFMIPETNKNRSIDIYKCIEWPNNWLFFKNLEKDIIGSDNTLVYKDEMWWLFTTINKTADYTGSVNNINIFYTKDIFNIPLQPHVGNPVKIDAASSRSGGYFFEENNSLYRPAQNCENSYGGSIVINRIDVLNENSFSESLATTIIPNIKEKQIGLHTYNKTSNLTFFDYLYKNNKFKLIFYGFNKYNQGKTFIKNYACYPPQSNGNHFLSILKKELEEHGWNMETFNLKYYSIYKNRLNTNLLYFHWPETIWRSENSILSVIKSINFIFLIKFSKLLGYKLAWSAHNTMPHQYKSSVLERSMRKFILAKFDLIINHAYNAKDEQSDQFNNTGKLSVDAIHGHYEDQYQPKNKITRETLGIPVYNKVIYLNYNGKEYKGCDDFIKSFLECDLDNITLLVSGHNISDKIKFDSSSAQIKIIDRFLEDDELADIIILADAVALPYKKITTSGFYFLALTFKKGIIAKDLPFFKLHSSQNTILLYNDESSLQKVLEKIISGWKPNIQEIDLLLDQFSWNKSAAIIAKKFDDITNN